MDEQQQKELQRLEAERQKLTDDQRRKHDDFCRVLKANENYNTASAIEAVQAIQLFDGTLKLGRELEYIAQRADQQGIIDQRNAFAEADKQKALQAQNSLQEKIAKEEQEKLAREQQEAQKLAAHEAAIREPIPGAIERFDGVLAASKAQEQRQRDAEAASRSHPDSGTPLWKAQAATLDRQRRQFGRYDFPPNNPPGDGARVPVPPSPEPPKPPNPPTPARGNLPLTANEIFARHNNPELEALFQNEQQVRADQKKAATPEAAVQNNVPTAAAPEFDPMADFVSPERRKKAAEAAAAARAANPSQSFGRGGGRGRG